ncbi:uncharacterized protein LOC117344702 [Pecten maximus]|uniref:uncharacterized protein LOC117344702 n=1 Tax=Pecten maximus TaxID=6579 RepID=UPI0014581285|nr:uncharacterized protein LOC117344702 [Pecten maximus]
MVSKSPESSQFSKWVMMVSHASRTASEDGLGVDAPPTEPVHYSDAHLMGIVSDTSITGTSGLCSSRIHPNVLYVHNDRGDNSHVYALNGMTGQLMASIKVTGASNYDWEDIACGPCGGGQEGHCIYIGDIGDHSGSGARDIIYKIREPAVLPSSPRHDVKVRVDGELHFTWNPPGLDADTLMVDPQGVLYVITKAPNGHGQVGAIPPHSWTDSDTPVHFTNTLTLPITTSDPGPLGGDISKDGRKILIKTSNQILYWYVPIGVSYLDVLSKNPVAVPYEHQIRGQAVGWDQNGQGYYTLAEGWRQGLYYYGQI